MYEIKPHFNSGRTQFYFIIYYFNKCVVMSALNILCTHSIQFTKLIKFPIWTTVAQSQTFRKRKSYKVTMFASASRC